MPIKLVEGHGLVREPRQMTPAEYTQAQADFYSHFTTVNEQPIRRLSEDVRWSSMADLVAASGIHGFKGIVFYHGLVGDELRFGLRVVEMRPLAYNADMEDFEFHPRLDTPSTDLPTHEIDGPNNVIIPLQHHNWPTWIANYRTMKVDRLGNNDWRTLNILGGMDPLKVILPWEDEIFLLWLNNRQGLRAHEPVLCIRAISLDHDQDPRPGFRHGIGMHMRYFEEGVTVDLLQPGNQVVSYQDSAADLGHRCPPRCRYYKVPRP